MGENDVLLIELFINQNIFIRKTTFHIIERLIKMGVFFKSELDCIERLEIDDVDIIKFVNETKISSETHLVKKIIFPLFKKKTNLEEPFFEFVFQNKYTNFSDIPDEKIVAFAKELRGFEKKRDFIFLFLAMTGRLNETGLNWAQRPVINLLHRNYIKGNSLNLLDISGGVKIDVESENYSNDIFGECESPFGRKKQLLNSFSTNEKINKNLYGLRRAKEIAELQYLIEGDLELFAQRFLECIQKDESFEIVNRRLNGETLEEIGRAYGVTRERIRQKEAKFYVRNLDLLDVYIQVKIKNYDKWIVDIEGLFDDFDFECYPLIEGMLKHGDAKRIVWNKNLEAFMLKKHKDNEKIIIEALEPTEDVFTMEEKIAEVDMLYPQSNANQISYRFLEGFYRKRGFRVTENKVINSEIYSKEKLIALVVREHYPEGIAFDEESYLEVAKYLKEEYDYYVSVEDFDIRNIFAHIDETLILWGPSSRIHISNVYIDDEVLELVIEKFKKYMEENPYALLEDLYQYLKSDLKYTSVDDRYKLYGLLRYYLGEEYYFKKLTVRNRENFIGGDEIILECLKSKGISTKEEIAKELNFKTEYVSAKLSFMLEVGYSNDKVYLIKNKEFPLSLIEKCKGLIDEEIKNDGYAVVYKIYREFADDMKAFNIFDGIELFRILKYYLMKEYNFFSPYIQTKERSKAIKLKEIISSLFENKNFLTFNEFSDFLYNKGLVSAQYNCWQTFDRIGMKMFRIDSECFTVDSKIHLSDEELLKIKSILKEMEKSFGTIAYYQIQDYLATKEPIMVNLGVHSIKLNEYLLSSIVEFYMPEYDVLSNKSYTDAIECKTIICPKGRYLSFTEWASEQVKNHFKDRYISIYEIEKFLMEQLRLVNKPRLPKYIEQELNLDIDEFGKVRM